MDKIRRQFRSAITTPAATRIALTVAFILIVELNPARAFAQGTWTKSVPDPTPRWWSGAGMFRGTIAVAGGFSPSAGNLTLVEVFPCGTGWCAKAPLPNGPQTGAAAGTDFSPSLNSATFEVAGGNNGSGPVATLSIMSGLFLWSTGPSMPTARENPANLFGGSQLAVVGGNTSSGVTGALEIYDASTNSWTSKAPMPAPRSNLGADSGYAIGGRDSSGAVLATNELYDSATNTWTTKAPMPTPRADLAVVAFNGLIYAIGGRGADGAPLATVEVYDSGTDSWTTETPMPTARWGLVALVGYFPSVSCGVCAPGHAIYAMGGAIDAAGTTATGANEVFLPHCGTVNVAPSSLSFSNAGTQSVTVTNTGSDIVEMYNTFLSPSPPYSIPLNGDGCSRTGLAVSASCPIQVNFNGSSESPGTLFISDSACNSPQTVPLQAPTPTCGQVSVSPASLSFEAGKEGKQTVTVTNTGSLNVNVITTAITNTIRKDFNVSEDKCAGTTLASSGSCNVSVSFDGTIHQAAGTLTITDTACNSPQAIGLQDVNFK